MKNIISILIGCFFTITLMAQQAQLEWALGFGGPGSTSGKSVDYDQAGNVYLTGAFSNTADLDPGPGVINFISNGLNDIFISKVDAAGNLIYSKGIGGIDNDEGLGIAADNNGNAYITGHFTGYMDFDPGPAIELVPAVGDNDVFILKLDSIGDFLWVKTFGGNYVDMGKAIDLDEYGNIYVTGHFWQTVDFDPGPGVNNITSTGQEDAFIIKLNSSGSFVWAEGFGSSFEDQANDIVIDYAGNVQITGSYYYSFDADPGPNVSALPSFGGNNWFIYIIKLTSQGSFIWAVGAGGYTPDTGYGIDADTLGNTYITGTFKNEADFDPGPAVVELDAGSSPDVFIAKYGPAGTLVWARHITASSYQYAYGIAVDKTGNSFTTVKVPSSNLDLDPGPGSYSEGGGHYVVKLDAGGNLSWAAKAGQASGYDIAIDDDFIYDCGNFNGTNDFDPNSGVSNLVSSGTNAFIWKLSQTIHPIAGFSSLDADIVVGEAVQFSDETLNTPTSWFWDFGDGSTATIQNPNHIYNSRGAFNVTLIASDGIEADTIIRENFVVVVDEFPTFDWAESMGGSLEDKALSIVTDDLGNVYTTGTFEGTADFDPGIGVSNLTSVGYRDIFITKIDAMGNLVWVKKIGGQSSDFAYSIAIDATGNVYLTGLFRYTIDFDPGPAVYNLSAYGGFEIFILKLTSSGNFSWAKRIGGSDDDVGNAIAFDASNNVYVTGYFSYFVDFDPGPAYVELNSYGDEDIFVVKFSSSGGLVWARQMGTADTQIGVDIATDAYSNVYITGTFKGNADFNPISGAYYINSNGNEDVFVVKLTNFGTLSWARAMGGTGEDLATAIEIDPDGNVITTGTFNGTVDFDPGAGIYNLTSASGSDAFISKLDPSGNFMWAKQLGGVSSQVITDLAVDVAGNLYLSGYFSGATDFFSGQGNYTLEPNGSTDLFISKFNPLGELIYVEGIGGSNNEVANSITVDDAGNIFASGYFQTIGDFDPGIQVSYLGSAGEEDAFVVKFAPPGISAMMSVSDTSITLGDVIQYTDESDGFITNWLWDFGDGNLSTDQNPSHTYTAGGIYSVTLIVSNNLQSDTVSTGNYITVGMDLMVESSSVDLNCYGDNSGSINLTILNGIPPYTFMWSNGESSEDLLSLSEGLYTVTVNDINNVSFSDTFEILQPTQLQHTSSILNDQCNGGTGEIELFIIGGTPPYTYGWSTTDTSSSINNLANGIYTAVVTDENNCSIIESFEINVPAIPLSMDQSSTDISCFGNNNGSIDLSISGGFPDTMTFIWSNGASTEDLSNLGPGIYFVTMVQNTYLCMLSDTVTITEPDLLMQTGNASSDSCFGNPGSIDLVVSGGTMPYIFNWSSGDTTQNLTNLTEGVYTVVITDINNCISGDSFNIIQPPIPFTLDLLATDASCYQAWDGSIDATISGGFPDSVTIDWSNGSTNEDINGLLAGFYQITVSQINYQCEIVEAIEILEPAEIDPNEIIQAVECHGENSGSITIAASGGTPPFTYNWSTGLSSQSLFSLYAGQYELTITDAAACTETFSYQVTEPNPITVVYNITNVPSSTANSGAVQVIIYGGSPPYSYHWSNGASVPNNTGLIAGIYSITITDNNQCTWDSTFTVQNLAAINEDPENTAKLTLLQNNPNPFSRETKISYLLPYSDEAKLTIFNILGKKEFVLKQGFKEAGSHNIVFINQNLSPGYYYYRLETGTSAQTRKMLLIKN